MAIRNCLGICEVFVSRLRRLNAFRMRTHTSGFANARLQCGLTCGRAAGAWNIRPDTSLALVHIFRGNMKKVQRLKPDHFEAGTAGINACSTPQGTQQGSNLASLAATGVC